MTGINQPEQPDFWRPIAGYPGYKAGRDGSIYSEAVKRNLKPRTRPGDEYVRVDLNGKTHYVHVLIATTFLENPQGLPEVDHKNRDKRNNSVDNLEWVTHEENMKRWQSVEFPSKPSIDERYTKREGVC